MVKISVYKYVLAILGISSSLKVNLSSDKGYLLTRKEANVRLIICIRVVYIGGRQTILGFGLQRKNKEPHGHDYRVVVDMCMLKNVSHQHDTLHYFVEKLVVQFVHKIYDVNKFL